MARVHLNDRKVQSLEAGKHQTDFWDTNLPGFGVRVSPKGRKSFVVKYSAGGKQRRMTLGWYPAMSLSDGRQAAKAALYEVANGGDPQGAKQAEKLAETFDELAEEYMRLHSKPKKKTWREDDRKIKTNLLPAWSGRKARDISRRDVIQLLDQIVARGAPIQANRIRALISKIFNFGLSRDIVEQNPTHAVPRPSKERPSDRVLTLEEVERVWRELDGEDPIVAAQFKMRILTAQRGGEILNMRWEEIAGDWWILPGERAKNGLTHRVPLSPQVQALLDDVRPLTGHTEFIFHSPRRTGRPINAVRKAAKRIAERAEVDFAPHDLRRTAASHMTSLGFTRLVVGKILNHVETGVTAIYDRHSYDKEKREALEAWGCRVEEITAGGAHE